MDIMLFFQNNSVSLILILITLINHIKKFLSVLEIHIMQEIFDISHLFPYDMIHPEPWVMDIMLYFSDKIVSLLSISITLIDPIKNPFRF